MRKDAAHKIERRFQDLTRDNAMFREYCELHPDNSMEELLAGWKWVQKLVERVIHRTIRDLTGPPAAPKLHHKKDR